ncbi:MAG: glycosyltransferase, partial [bacterium]|nr:glycosyltransferase [bacterium]
MRTTIVIPTYNERENLRPLIERIAALRVPDLAILIVDDASPDGTGTLAEDLAREFPTPSRSPSRREGEKNSFPTSARSGGGVGGVAVSVLHRPKKTGLGAAYVAGFARALADGTEVIVQMDADGSHDPA